MPYQDDFFSKRKFLFFSIKTINNVNIKNVMAKIRKQRQNDIPYVKT